MNRRQFLRRLAALWGVVSVGPLVQACERAPGFGPAARPTPEPRSPPPPAPVADSTEASVTGTPVPTATAAPTATTVPRAATVALVATTDRAAGVARAIELLGPLAVDGRHALLKPNFNSADEAPGSTHGDVLRALVTSLQDLGVRSITVGDRSGMGGTREVMRRLGVFELATELGLETAVFDELSEDAWEILDGDDFHWSRGFPVTRMLLESECVVQTCNLKTHRHGGHFSLSLKNSVGFVAKNYGSHNFMTELHRDGGMRQRIAEVNTAYDPSLVVVDGVEAFVRGGPDTGTKAATGVILAGTDRVAIDAVGVAILRLFGTTDEVSRGSVFEQEQIARAVELGLGVDSPARIAFAVGDAESEAYAARVTEVLAA